ncbi:hypothetical protein HNQ59_003414 [Chitinivorax tropicus]|uniref:TcdA/TcdB toxin pore forming domain-containing protein n=1 Tax=Chitinivorax tropicus TaxID=714531 RepID=A0A840MNT6_9PROT|nr:TcdA/TcdB pore-forming domain-containing protein [Chitinivorax tropicus]MBB5020100.1 hypothetical protein [Chitinivorax tropicus]
MPRAHSKTEVNVNRNGFNFSWTFDPSTGLSEGFDFSRAEAALKEKDYVFVGYHGTNIAAAKSIAEDGVRDPGTRSKTDPNNVFYTSPSAEVAHGYSLPGVANTEKEIKALGNSRGVLLRVYLPAEVVQKYGYQFDASTDAHISLGDADVQDLLRHMQSKGEPFLLSGPQGSAAEDMSHRLPETLINYRMAEQAIAIPSTVVGTNLDFDLYRSSSAEPTDLAHVKTLGVSKNAAGKLVFTPQESRAQLISDIYEPGLAMKDVQPVPRVDVDPAAFFAPSAEPVRNLLLWNDFQNTHAKTFSALANSKSVVSKFVPQSLFLKQAEGDARLGLCKGLSQIWAQVMMKGGDTAVQGLFDNLFILSAMEDPARTSVDDLAFSNIFRSNVEDIHNQISNTDLSAKGSLSLAEVMSGLAAANQSKTWMLNTANHAMALSVTVEGGQRRYSFYDPNLGQLTFNTSDVDVVRNTIQTHLNNLRDLYQVSDRFAAVYEVNPPQSSLAIDVMTKPYQTTLEKLVAMDNTQGKIFGAGQTIGRADLFKAGATINGNRVNERTDFDAVNTMSDLKFDSELLLKQMIGLSPETTAQYITLFGSKANTPLNDAQLVKLLASNASPEALATIATYLHLQLPDAATSLINAKRSPSLAERLAAYASKLLTDKTNPPSTFGQEIEHWFKVQVYVDQTAPASGLMVNDPDTVRKLGSQLKLENGKVLLDISQESGLSRTQAQRMLVDAVSAASISKQWNTAVAALAEKHGLVDWQAQPQIKEELAGDKIAFYNPNTEEVWWVDVDKPVFREFSDFIKEKATAFSRGMQYDPKTGEASVQEHASPAVHTATMNAAFLIQSLLSLQDHGLDHAGPALKTALYLQLAQGALGIAQDAISVASVARAAINSEAQIVNAVSRATSVVSKVSSAAGSVFAVANVVMSGVLLDQAIQKNDPVATASAATQLAFAIGGAGLAAGSLAASATGAVVASSFLDGLAVPLAGISIGAVALAEAYADNARKFDELLKYINNVGESLENGGIVKDAGAGVLRFNGDVALSEINLKNMNIHYGDVKATATTGGTDRTTPDGFPSYLSSPIESKSVSVDVYYQLNKQKTDFSYRFSDPITTLILPSGTSRFLALSDTEQVHFKRPSIKRSAAYTIMEGDPNFMVAWFAPPGDWAYTKIDVQHKFTPVNVILDTRVKTIMTPVLNTDTSDGQKADSWMRENLSYTLNGGGGQYRFVLGDGPFNHYVQIKQSGLKEEAWLIDPSPRIDLNAWKGESIPFVERISGPINSVLSTLQFGNLWLQVKGQSIRFDSNPHNVMVGLPDLHGIHLWAALDFSTGKMSISADFRHPLYDAHAPARNMHFFAKVLQSSSITKDARVTNGKDIRFTFGPNLSGIYNAESDSITFLKQDANGKISGIWMTNENMLWDLQADPTFSTYQSYDQILSAQSQPVHQGEIFTKDDHMFMKARLPNGTSGQYVAEITPNGLLYRYIDLTSPSDSVISALKKGQINSPDQLAAILKDELGSAGVTIAADALLVTGDARNRLYFQGTDGKYALSQGTYTDKGARYTYSALDKEQFILIKDDIANYSDTLTIDTSDGLWAGWEPTNVQLLVESDRPYINITADVMRFKETFIEATADGVLQQVKFLFDKSKMSNLKIEKDLDDLVLTFASNAMNGQISHIRLGNALKAGSPQANIQFGQGQIYTPTSLFLSQFMGTPSTSGAGDLGTSKPLVSQNVLGLADGVMVPKEKRNGLIDESFLTGDGQTRFEILFDQKEAALFSHELGAYEIDDAGNMVNPRILSTNPDVMSDQTISVDVAQGNQLGFFIIPKNVLPGAGVLSLKGARGEQANVLDLSIGDVKLTLGGVEVATPLHSYGNFLNPDDVEHVVSGKSQDGQRLVIGFEDQVGGGDFDYDDVVFSVKRTPSAPTQLTADKLIQSMAGMPSKGLITDAVHAPASSKSALINLAPSRV